MRVDGVIGLRDTNPNDKEGVNSDLDKLQRHYRKEALDLRSDERIWRLNVGPTKELTDADNKALEGHYPHQTYEDYVYKFARNMERDPEKVLDAQRKLLANTLNHAHRVRIIANAGDEHFTTDLTLVTQKKSDDGKFVPRRFFNQPGGTINSYNDGSEVFVGPSSDDELGEYKEAVTGTLAYKHGVMFGGRFLPNLILHYRNGQVDPDNGWEIRGDGERIEELREWFDSIIREPGVNRLGELGIGTNPLYSDRPTADVATGEKATGIHLAAGRCYTDKRDEAGDMADLDNGNISEYHEDMVMLMNGKEPGQIWAEVGSVDTDGIYKKEWRLVAQNGVFMKKDSDGKYLPDSDLAILGVNADDPTSNNEPFNATLPAA